MLMVSILSILSIFASTTAYYHGAPCQALYSMFPNHDNLLMQNSSLENRYFLTVVKASNGRRTETYVPGETYKIRLSGPGFRGFLLQVRPVRDDGRVDEVHRVGKFLVREEDWDKQGIKLLSCSPAERFDSITHSTNFRREYIEVEWKPETAHGTLQIVFTVVEEKERFWTNVKMQTGRLELDANAAPITDNSPENENTINDVRRKQPNAPVTQKPENTGSQIPENPENVAVPESSENPETAENVENVEKNAENPEDQEIYGSGEEPPEISTTTTPQIEIEAVEKTTKINIEKVVVPLTTILPETDEKSNTTQEIVVKTTEKVTVDTTKAPEATIAPEPEPETQRSEPEPVAETTKPQITEDQNKTIIDFAIEDLARKVSADDAFIERIFAEIKSVILAERAEKNRNSTDQKYIINITPTDVRRRPVKESGEIEEIPSENPEKRTETPEKPAEIDTTTTQAATTTTKATTVVATTKAPTTTTLKTTTTIATTTGKSENQTESGAEPTAAPKIGVEPNVTTIDPPSTTAKPTTRAQRLTTRGVVSNVNIDPEVKCEKDYWMECKDWSESECELIWVRQNCRKKCCQYLLRNLQH